MEEMNEKENKKAILENKTRDLEKKESTMKEHEHKIQVIDVILDILTKKAELVMKQQELQMNNFGFTQDFKPIEKFQTLPEYIGIVKGLQELQNKETLLKIEEDIYAQERFKVKALEDKVFIEESIKGLKKEIEDLKKELGE